LTLDCRQRDIVSSESLDRLQQAKILITNFHRQVINHYGDEVLKVFEV